MSLYCWFYTHSLTKRPEVPQLWQALVGIEQVIIVIAMLVSFIKVSHMGICSHINYPSVRHTHRQMKHANSVLRSPVSLVTSEKNTRRDEQDEKNRKLTEWGMTWAEWKRQWLSDSWQEKHRAGGRKHIGWHHHRQWWSEDRKNERWALAEQSIHLCLLLPSALLAQTQKIGYNLVCVCVSVCIYQTTITLDATHRHTCAHKTKQPPPYM